MPTGHSGAVAQSPTTPSAWRVLFDGGSLAPLGRLGLGLLTVLLAENIYRNADEALRWHINLPTIALGGLAAFDVLLYAAAALSRD